MTDTVFVAFKTLLTRVPVDLLRQHYKTPTPDEAEVARALAEIRVGRAVAEMRQRIRGRLRGNARVRLLACYESALRETEGLR